MKKSGFTLIELLTASMVLAVLAAIAIPNFTRWEVRAKESEVKSVTHSLQMAVEDYKATPGWEGMKPTGYELFAIVIPSYLSANVQSKRNPFNQAQTYATGGIVSGAPGGVGQAGYQYAAQNTPYTIAGAGTQGLPS